MADLKIFFLLITIFLIGASSGFQSDELLLDDDEFGLEGGARSTPLDIDHVNPIRSQPSIKKRSSSSSSNDMDNSDSKIQFLLEHAFGGDSDFVTAGTFTARLKTWNHGGKTLTKLRFSRDALTDLDKKKFENLVKEDDFYRIRLPSNVQSPPGKDYVIASVKARCLPRDSLDEHIVIYTDGVNILGVNYGSPGACPYPRQQRLPKKWVFNSYTLLKSSEQAPRAPAFVEDIFNGDSLEGENLPPPERTFWAKYWVYLIPLGLIVMNAVTQAMNMPEEGGQPGAQPQPSNAAVRRR